mmetsp:Transcript_41445/g.81969  ORF Transcript_41445/g.81969 Transcript_41445/m.81969 type:complete len:276 (+) Transcript_41445:78-905(+)
MVCATACHIPQATLLCKFDSSVAQPAFPSPLVELRSSPRRRPLAVCSTTVSEACSGGASPSRHAPVADWNSVYVGHCKPLETDVSRGTVEHALHLDADEVGPEDRRRAWSAAVQEPAQDKSEQRHGVEGTTIMRTSGALRCSQSDWEAIRFAFGLVPQDEDIMQGDASASVSRRSSERRVQFCPGEPLDFEEEGEELDLPGRSLPRTPHPLTPRAPWQPCAGPLVLQPPGTPPAVAPSTARHLWRVQCCPDVVRDPCGRAVAWPAEAQVALACST